MTKVYIFPEMRIETQLFHVPGAGYDGGLTSGGSQFITPEPGGFGVLEVQLSIRDEEWDSPFASWLMSKINGQVFRIRLAASPQIAYSAKRAQKAAEGSWPDQDEWAGDFTASFSAAALKGSVQVEIDLTGVGPILAPGHVIGHEFDTYKVDEIEYDGDTATVTVTPPLRRDIAMDDDCPLRPWFMGRISNGADIRAAYNNLGHVKPGNIVFHEAVL